MPKANVGDGEIYYESHGAGDPILLVPGIPNFPSAEIVASRIDAIVDFDRTADLPKIKTRTLVICAKDDFLTPPYFSEELAKKIPGAKLKVLDRGGHCASETALEEFNKAVLGFIDG